MKLSAIRVWHKLLILGLIALGLCAVPTALYVFAANKEIRTALTALSGLAPATEVVHIVQALQSHRDLAAAVLSGNQALANERIAKEKEVSAAFAKARAAVPASATPVIELLDKVGGEWSAFTSALKDQAFPFADSYSRHTQLIASTLNLLERNLDYFGLSLDPEVQSYFLILAAFNELPRLTESMGRMRATGTAVLGIKQATTEERVTISAMLERTRDELERSRALMQKAISAGTGAMEKLEAASLAAVNDTKKLIAVTDLEFVRIEVLRYDVSDYLKLATTAIDSQFNLIDAARTEIDRILHDRVSSRRWTMAGLLGLIAALLMVGVTVMFWVARSITRPLNAAMKDADAIAAGRLDSPIQNVGTDEVGQLRRAMSDMQRNLTHIVSSIRENSDAVGTAAREIASSTQDMSARTESQASSLEQTAASMEELNVTFQKNDESGKQVSNFATQAAAAAEQGGVVVGKVTGTMQEIDASSKKIAEIIGVIDGIAFQTNILALNAAVEAARAGEQGRGFAVVAAEVRALAQRSADASKEIRALISDSVKKVQAGTREAAESRKAMDGILASVRKVTTTMAEMQTVREDQRRGVSQISNAVEQMNQGTQQSAAMVEEIAATADLLSSQAQDLVQAVSAFKLAGGDGFNDHVRPLVHARARAADTDARTIMGTVANDHTAPGLALSKEEVAKTIAKTWRESNNSRMLPSRPEN
ncbi:MAG TPA: methyl-accepting chemotaxis protein [Burkholderiales bacterium]|nr:methyl-accepting chemotaxis protein [Burkholderiales bacterium]